MDTKMLIGSGFQEGTEQAETIFNPRTGESIVEIPEASAGQIDQAVSSARGAFSQWSRTSPAERSAHLLSLAARIEAEAANFAALEALNCGKPINAVSGDEMPAVVDCFRYFAGAIRNMQGSVAGEYLPGFT